MAMQNPLLKDPDQILVASDDYENAFFWFFWISGSGNDFLGKGNVLSEENVSETEETSGVVRRYYHEIEKNMKFLLSQLFFPNFNWQ